MPFGRDGPGWPWKQHLNCPCILKRAFPRQESGIWSLCSAFCRVQIPNLSPLCYCKIAIMTLLFLCVFPYSSFKTNNWAFKCFKILSFPFELVWLCSSLQQPQHFERVPRSMGYKCSFLQTPLGGFQLSKTPVNSTCWFHLTLRKPILHLPLLLWKDERDEKAATEEKEKIHQCHQFRARSFNSRARAMPAGVIVQSVAAPWMCEQQLSESH